MGIIGLGVGGKHIPAFDSHPACQVTALCDFSKRKLFAFTKHCPTAKSTQNADEILEDPAIDVVSIASFDNYHFEQVLKAIRNRKHVFVEKPLCLHYNEALEIKKAIEQYPELRISSNLNLRTCPRFKRLREAVRLGELGRIFYLEGDYLWGRIHKLKDGWRKDIPVYSIILGAAVHMIDLVMWVVGSKPIEVQGYGNRIATAGTPMRYNDFGVVLLRFENSTLAKISGNGGCMHPHFHRVAVYGTEKTFLHELSGGIWLESRDPKAKPTDIAEEYPGVTEKGKIITSFIDSILDEAAEPIVPVGDVFDTMSVCFAAERSIQERKPIMIEYI
ncbi:MAG: Gfo/Idh/MocA family oxidoreductase [Euryarchaeota archaeon]|nr:Gfo/Idh/MocA family oxidoreductase [Euryarchaeota archaeon]